MGSQSTQDDSPFKESLITEEKTASPMFRRLCNGLYKVLSEMNIPDDTSEVPTLTPKKMATYYRLLGENFDTTFLETAPESLAYIYQMLGCYYSLQPTGLSAHRPPTIPALLPSGFLRWQLVQILLCPDVHAKCLQRAVEKFSIIDPVTDRPFPDTLPDEILPSEPDQAMTAWHQSQLKQLQEDMIMEAQGGGSGQDSASSTSTPPPPPRYTAENGPRAFSKEAEYEARRRSRRNEDTSSSSRNKNSRRTRHASYMGEKHTAAAAGRENLNRRHTEGSERGESQYRARTEQSSSQQQRYPPRPRAYYYSAKSRKEYEQDVPSDSDEEVNPAYGSKGWGKKYSVDIPVGPSHPSFPPSFPPKFEPLKPREDMFNRYRRWTSGTVPTTAYKDGSTHPKADVYGCYRFTSSPYSFLSRGIPRCTMEEGEYAAYSRHRATRSIDYTDDDDDDDEHDNMDREEADYFGPKRGNPSRKPYRSPTPPYSSHRGSGSSSSNGGPVRPRYYFTQPSTPSTSLEDAYPSREKQRQRQHQRDIFSPTRIRIPPPTLPTRDEVDESEASDAPNISPDVLRRTKNGSPHPNVEKMLSEPRTSSEEYRGRLSLGEGGSGEEEEEDNTEAEIDREHERIARKLRTRIIKRLAMTT